MRTIVDGFREMVHLIGDTFRLWWRNLLPLVTWFLAGYIGFRASINAAIWLSEHQHSSLGVGVFSAGVLIQIAATVGMIRTCANSLYRWRDAASNKAEETSDPTQRGLLELLSITLLPLVAVWSAWGFLDDQVQELTTSNLVQRGLQPGGQFFELGGTAYRAYLPAIVILLVLRRVIEAIDDRWPSRPAKFTQVWAESFFLLLTVVVTPFAIADFKSWFKERNFWYLSVDWWDGAKEFFAGIHIPVPAGLEFLWGFFWESLWPLFKLGVAEPLTWLAITTVVFGHRVLSSGGVFRGTRLERRLGHRVDPDAPKQNRIVALTNQAPNLLLGGLREKFYPALNAFRLLVRVGPVFLGVVCMVYTFWLLGSDWAFVALQRGIGVHGQQWGLMNHEIAAAIRDILFETLRIALLAAAFDLCISVGAERRAEAAEASEATVAADEKKNEPEPVTV
ncbi:hypothetical protein EV644_103355 [Kribbella orskensis]|uniref:ABC transmembrane type-1 domain-containing protein n=1 Tax=Kribbella orskensis TaxID=2512216 RepID=A0ABY2BPU3_9ACTN|nr:MULTISPECIES: hypothetical protein [Kribbella]TCN39565.1 hypothetical protein EV642_10666 [Kribbella sp. VKM Ac-2500]TCO27653.1 hypothetical protein EV644_103355 [Kribbella orskensis]